MRHLASLIADKDTVGKIFDGDGKQLVVASADDFAYTDPVDKSVSKNQVLHNLL